MFITFMITLGTKNSIIDMLYILQILYTAYLFVSVFPCGLKLCFKFSLYFQVNIHQGRYPDIYQRIIILTSKIK